MYYKFYHISIKLTDAKPALVKAHNEILLLVYEHYEPNCYALCTRTPQLICKILSSPLFSPLGENVQSAIKKKGELGFLVIL